jgi:hypothetical protein
MGIEEQEIQTKGMDNLIIKVIAENFPSIEKVENIQMQEAYRTPKCHDQK